MIRRFAWDNVDSETLQRFDNYLSDLGEVLLNHRYPSPTQDRPDFNATTIYGVGYAISAVFPFFRGDSPPTTGYSPRVIVNVASHSTTTLSRAEDQLREIFKNAVEVPVPDEE